MEYISSRDNPQVKEYLKLSCNKKSRKESGRFVLEGARLCAEILKERPELLEKVFITDGCKERYGDICSLFENDVPEKIRIISDSVGKALASTEGTQGIFAVCRVLDKISLSSKINNGGKYIALHHIQDPGNLGTIIRTADALGIDAVILCGCCDLYNPKTIRSTMGSLFRLPIIEEASEDKIFEALENAEVDSYAAALAFDSLPLNSCDFSGGGTVWIGNEGNGLTDDVISGCKAKLIIPMKGTIDSFNAAMAACIIMWEMTK